MKVPLLDLTRAYREIESEVARAVERVLHSQQMILGPVVHEFEQSLGALCGSMFAVSCASGTDALLLALLAAGVEPGDEVVTTPFTFFATASSICHAGARPVFVDIDPGTFNMNPGLIEPALTSRTKAILPVHLYGQPADMEAILEIAEQKGAPVIEDAAQAIGALYHHRVCGSMGTLGCLSFYPTKNLGAAGDGGAVLTEDEALAEELKSLRGHGVEPEQPGVYRRVGLNSRLDALQAAILNVKMKHLRQWNETRRRLARHYTEGLTQIGEVTPPHVAGPGEHVFHQYVIRAPERDELRAYLEKHGVATRVFYPVPLHLQPCFKSLGGRKGDFPETERACREVLSLPIFPGLTRKEQDYVIEHIRRFFTGKRSRVSLTGADAED